MRFMNTYDIERAVRLYDPSVTPNRAYLARVVSALEDYANENSDGWHMWPKPANACRKAFELLDGGTFPDEVRRMEEDATDAEVKAALSPIKAFLTRQGVRHESVLPSRQTALAWS